MDNIFGMDIKRFSVLFLAIIILLALIGSFYNLQLQSSINVKTGGINVPSIKYNYYDKINTYTVTLIPSLESMKLINASVIFKKPNGTLLFDLENTSTTLFNAYKYLIELNSTEITPSSYSELLAILASLQPQYYVEYNSSYLSLVPPEPNDIFNMTNYRIEIRYPSLFNFPVSYKHELEGVFPKGVSIIYNNTNESLEYHFLLYDNFTNKLIQFNYSVPYKDIHPGFTITFSFHNQVTTFATFTIQYNSINISELTQVYAVNILNHGLTFKAWTENDSSCIEARGTVTPVSTYPSWFSYPPSLYIYDISNIAVLNSTNKTGIVIAYIPINISASIVNVYNKSYPSKNITAQVVTLKYNVTYYNNFTFNKYNITYYFTLNAYKLNKYFNTSNYTAIFNPTVKKAKEKNGTYYYYFANVNSFVSPFSTNYTIKKATFKAPYTNITFLTQFKGFTLIYNNYYDFIIFYAKVYNGTDPTVCPEFTLHLKVPGLSINKTYDGTYYFINGSSLIHRTNLTYQFIMYTYDYLGGIFYRHYTGGIANLTAIRHITQLNSTTYLLTVNFKLSYKLFPPPSWIFEPLVPEPVQDIQYWYDLLENLTIAHFLMSVVTSGQTALVKPLYLFKLNITRVINATNTTNTEGHGNITYYMYFRVYFFNNLTLAFNSTVFKIRLANFTNYTINIDGIKADVNLYNLANVSYVFNEKFYNYTNGTITVWTNGNITLVFYDNDTYYKFPQQVLDYYKFEYFSLANEFSQHNLNEAIELASYSLPWNESYVQRYDFYTQKYINYQIGIVNVQEVPSYLLNSTSYFNDTNDDVIYVIDPAYYPTFGNCFTFNNKSVYLLGGQPFPQVGQSITLNQGFYIPTIVWAVVSPYQEINTEIRTVYQPPQS